VAAAPIPKPSRKGAGANRDTPQNLPRENGREFRQALWHENAVTVEDPPSDGQVPTYEAANNRWIPGTGGGGAGADGCCEVLMSSVTLAYPAPSVPLGNDGPGVPESDYLYGKVPLL
jgi:hypothetical protein